MVTFLWFIVVLVLKYGLGRQWRFLKRKTKAHEKPYFRHANRLSGKIPWIAFALRIGLTKTKIHPLCLCRAYRLAAASIFIFQRASSPTDEVTHISRGVPPLDTTARL